MSTNKANLPNLEATSEEKIFADAELELEELSDHARPMVMNNINEA